tara:strand:+ start:119 stop:1402 length:1284 start_codon:yes stop_codon:yes gene_type:complete
MNPDKEDSSISSSSINNPQIYIQINDIEKEDQEEGEDNKNLPHNQSIISINELKFNNSLLELENYKCDSPITMSYNGSKSGSSNNSDIASEDDENNNTLSLVDIADLTQKNLSNVMNHKHLKKYSLKDIERSVEKYYDFENKYVSELDILNTYIKGQKNIYIQSKNINQWKLNLLMFPSLILTCCITVFSPFVDCEQLHNGVITGLNALVALLLSMINYLKLESSTEVFFQLANHYDKLEISLDLASSKLIFIDEAKPTAKKESILRTIKDVEEKIIEIKENYSFLIPEEIKTLFPVICHMNIFTFIKKMNSYRNSLILKLRDIKNEIRYIYYSLDQKKNKDICEKLKKRLEYLYKVKEEIKKELFDYKNAYNDLDGIFFKEIKSAETKMNRCGAFYICCAACIQPNINIKDINPVIDKYFHFLFTN